MKAYLGLGGNLGEPDRAIAAAARALDAVPGVRVLRLAPGYLSAPHGPADQPPYVDSVAEVDTSLAPRDLLAAVLGVEAALGRRRGGVRWGPRTIDIDLLLCGDSVVAEADLEVPHPRMAERRFVLEPLADLVPGLRHPRDGRTIAELLAACPDAPLPEGPFALPRGVRGRLAGHGGDLALVATGAGLADLAAEAAHAFVSAVVSRDLLREGDRREWSRRIDGPRDAGDAVADLLTEILVWLDADGWLPARVSAVEAGGELRASAFGGCVRGRGLAFERYPKAVTRHGMRVTRTARGSRIRLVVDL